MFLESLYTKSLRRYDKDLFAGRTKDGVLCVFRKTKRYEPVVVSDSFKILNLKEDKVFVFALTDTWTLAGVPRMWGVDHVLNRVKQIDTQANERFFEEMEEKNEAVDKSQKRKFRNEAEAFWADNRKEFIKAVDTTYGTTVSLSRDEPRKRLKDRSIKNGNC